MLLHPNLSTRLHDGLGFRFARVDRAVVEATRAVADMHSQSAEVTTAGHWRRKRPFGLQPSSVPLYKKEFVAHPFVPESTNQRIV